MAIYHFSAKVIGRASGRSAVAASAYRSGSRLHDQRLGRDHDFSNKSGVVHSEVLLPDGAPEVWSDRERLWNDVEACEVRKDAQLAREVEFALPHELNQELGIELARDFVQREFVDQGMVADLNVHWDIGEDGMPKPHAHVMLTMRRIDRDGNEPGFGQKARDWNRTEWVERWRERWAECANERLADLDIDARIDHRSLEAQGIDLEPQTQIGAPAQRIERQRIEREGIEAADRADLHRQIARGNGERIIADPAIALDAITRQQSTFTRHDMARFAHRHSDGIDQFNEVVGAIGSSPDLVELGKDGHGQDRFTTRDMIEAEQRLHRSAERMAVRELHRVSDADRERALARAEARGLVLSGEQADALAHVTDGRDMGIVVGHAGTGKSAMLGVAREAWEDAGYQVRGVALSGIAAENLESGSGITSRTIASLEHGWGQGRDLLTSRDVLVIDEAGMVGTRQMERVLSQAQEAGAKVVLVGDTRQLQSIEAGAAFRSLHERHGGVEITEVRRQREDWQREATRDLATGRTGEALDAYRSHDRVHEVASRDDARVDLIERWDRERQASPEARRIILTHTNEEVRALNEGARMMMREAGDLGEDVRVTVERGERHFAPGDRVMFLANERGLGGDGVGVRNGTLGTIEAVSTQSMSVRTDDGRSVSFDLKDYDKIDHGYAATVHKAQGMTVDRTHVLATPGMDAHGSYVALSRHRDGVQVHYGRDDFVNPDRLANTLSRDRSKDMASDYQRLDPAQGYAGRRGIAVRADGPDRQSDPEAALHRARVDALQRHARVVDAITSTNDPISRQQMRDLNEARKAFEEVRPHGWRDAEAAYTKSPELIREAATGRFNRAVRALQLETELRTEAALGPSPSINQRAERFVERWNTLDQDSQRQYQAGDMSGYKSTRAQMGDMAKSLERDPQLESVLANHKKALGIGIETGRSLGRELAFNHGIDMGIGRGLGL